MPIAKSTQIVAVGITLITGVVGLSLWHALDRPAGSIDSSAAGFSTERLSPDVSADPPPPAAFRPDPMPGSMQATLLEGTEAARNHIFGLVIADAGFTCPGVKQSGPIGDDGSAWRAHCGSGLTYWLQVDDFGNLGAAPMPYGDVRGFSVPIDQEGTIRRQFEQDTPPLELPEFRPDPR